MEATNENLLAQIEELQHQLAEAEQHIEAIRNGEVDAFAISKNNRSEVFTLESSDFAYRILVESFNEGALNISDEGLIVYTNAYFHELLRLPYDKVIGHSIFNYIHSSSVDHFAELFQKGLGGEAKAEINLIGANKIVPVYISLKSLYPTMQTVGMIVTDLTEKKKQEEKLYQQNRELEHNKNFITNVLESSNHGVLSYRAIRKNKKLIDFEIRYANALALEQFNMDASKIIGNTCLSIIPDAKKYGIWDRILNVMKTGIAEKHILASPSSPERIFEVLYTPLEDGVTSVFMEITEQKQREKALEEINAQLRQSEEKFSKLFDASPFSITLEEIPSGKLVNVNKHFTALTGFNRAEVIGQTSLDLQLINQEWRKKILHLLRKEGRIKNLELEIKSKSGTFIPILASIEIITIGNHDYFLKAINDISELKKSEREIEKQNKALEKMNKELQSFAYISSHDLQEPLRKIQIFSKRIVEKDKEHLSAKGQEYFKRMEHAAQRMQNLINDLLAYSRSTSATGKFEKTHLKDVLAEVEEDLKEELILTPATIESFDLCEVTIIPFQFRQLLHNLIGNSLKFCPPNHKPHITISCEINRGIYFDNKKLSPQTSYCHICVTDDGIGFDSQYSEKIFEVFQRLHGQSEYPGTGVGLSIVKKIIDNHRGHIFASSENGTGARFDIYIPV